MPMQLNSMRYAYVTRDIDKAVAMAWAGPIHRWKAMGAPIY
jgi:hypothetical protein